MLEIVLQLIISGVALGFVYALVGVEYTLIWQSAGLLNIAHIMLITGAAYIFGGTFVLGLGLPIWLSVILTLVVMFFAGYAISEVIFKPLRKFSSITYSVVGTTILGKILTEVYRLVYGSAAFTVPRFLYGTVRIGNLVFALTYVYIIVVAILLIILLQIFLHMTKPGKAMRCVAQNKNAAAIMGINVSQSISITTGISSVICGIIGILVIPLFQISLSMAGTIGLKGWAAGIVGGFGYIPGTILGGLFIGITESLVILFIPSNYKDIVAFILLLVVLLIRPGGIMRHKV